MNLGMGYALSMEARKMVGKKELIEEMGTIDVVHCELTSGGSFDIGTADYWIGAYLDKNGLAIESID